MTLEIIVLQVIGGLSEGMSVFFCAMGLTLIFGSLKVLNVSHGSIYMVGAYFIVAANLIMKAIPGHFYFALILATMGCGLLGGIIEIFILRPVYKLPEIYQFIVTFAVTFIVMDLVKIVWGGAYYTIYPPSYLQGPFFISRYIIPKYNAALIAFGSFAFIALWFFINKTYLGLIIRGITVDRKMMRLFGYNVTWIYTFVFMIGCGLAGLGGAAVVPLSAVGPGIDVAALIKAFIVLVVGGFGSIGGVLLASIIFGLVNAFGILLIPKLSLGFMYFIMAIILIFRPWGLLGKRIDIEALQKQIRTE